MADVTTTGRHAVDGIDEALIREQLERIIASASFHNSKRYPRFLQFVVEEKLKGNAELLKERVLGIEVFDKPANYEVAEDPIVRVAAGEIRKRIAQYYVEPGHEGELRIDLPPGRYVPEFYFPKAGDLHDKPAGPLHHPVLNPLAPTEVAATEPARKLRKKWAWMAGALVLLLAGMAVANFARQPAPIETFWKPVLASSAPPIICVADLAYFMKPEPGRDGSSLKEMLATTNHLALADVVALAHVAGILEPRGKRISLTISSSTTFTDLRQHPTILVGGMDNEWTMRLTKPLRFRIVRTENPNIIGIVDSGANGAPKWVVDYATPYKQLQKEYAIVARYKDPTTDQPTIVIAGVGPEGTIAAGEFVSTPSHLDEFASRAPRGWAEKNLEIVLETEVIDGKSGPPRIMAFEIW
jgi:hypothetical protein